MYTVHKSSSSGSWSSTTSRTFRTSRQPPVFLRRLEGFWRNAATRGQLPSWCGLETCLHETSGFYKSCWSALSSITPAHLRRHSRPVRPPSIMSLKENATRLKNGGFPRRWLGSSTAENNDNPRGTLEGKSVHSTWGRCC